MTIRYEPVWLQVWGVRPWELGRATVEQFYRMCEYAQHYLDNPDE